MRRLIFTFLMAILISPINVNTGLITPDSPEVKSEDRVEWTTPPVIGVYYRKDGMIIMLHDRNWDSVTDLTVVYTIRNERLVPVGVLDLGIYPELIGQVPF